MEKDYNDKRNVQSENIRSRKSNNTSSNKSKSSKSNSKHNRKSRRKLDPRKILMLIIGIAIIITVSIMISNVSKKNDKEKKAEEVFGTDYCESLLHMATKDLAPHTCSICGKEFQDSSMRADICDECSEELDRCDFCGKKLNEDIKEQRNELLGE